MKRINPGPLTRPAATYVVISERAAPDFPVGIEAEAVAT